MELNILAWSIIGFYIAAMIAMAIYLSRGQKEVKDYYICGNKIGAWPIAISTMATQCSTNSLLGAPAFVAFSVGGGLLWLQYELAVPFAMIFLMVFMLPYFRKLNIISIYAYLEQRFGVGTRTVLSVLFQFLRAFSTGVTVYGISLVLQACLGIPFWIAVVLLGVITVIYDSIGGMKGVVYSDVIQMIILYGSVVLTIVLAVNYIGGFGEVFNLFDPERMKAVDFAHTGLGDGKNFAFWPMLIGGLFLYMSYYGTDQTQVQRELSTKSVDDTNYSLFINGMLRFPLVLTYCFLGVCIGAFAVKFPEFISAIPVNASGTPNFNMAVPTFILKYFPHGLIGLVMVGLFAAAMSSLDSTINSLSAVTMQDIIKRFFSKNMTMKKELLMSRGLTVFWGAACIVFAFFVGDISDSIIVSVNKIGSLINGPILAVFLMGLLTRKTSGTGAVSGLICGFLGNLYLWVFQPETSWLWWNVIGFVVTWVVGWTLSFAFPRRGPKDKAVSSLQEIDASGIMMKTNWKPYYAVLAGYGVVILIIISIF